MKAFLIFRDRVSYGIRCAGAMRAAGLEPVIVDHGSTWPAALAWLARCEERGTAVLYRHGGHPRHMWEWEPFLAARGDERYVVTDPDVIPAVGVKPDWPQYLSRLLDEYPGAGKAGMGLRIDDLPVHYSRRQQVIDWEKQFWTDEMGPGIYRAPVDTTLAVYRERSRFELDGLRTGEPYVAEHLAWHENLEDLSPELAYYYAHAERGISHWAARGASAWGD